MALQLPPSFSSTSGAAVAQSPSKELRIFCGSVSFRRRRAKDGILSCGFSDRGHLQYYDSGFGAASAAESGRRMSMMNEKGVKRGKEKSMKKKQMKLVKGLSRGLSTFFQIGFGLDSNGDLIDQVKRKTITEAMQTLLDQLEKVKAQEKELKRRKKEEKARSKAMHKHANSETSSSSSSSSSSDSSDNECSKVVRMSGLKAKIGLQQAIEDKTSSHDSYPPPIIPTITSNVDNKDDLDMIPTCAKKIEVCMGGKCKKLGSEALLEEFQRELGIEGEVCGCKCMGKCRDGPNVKILNGRPDSLCSGVGLEDVSLIVANLHGENQN